MKKLIIVSLLFVSLLSVPFFVQAQTATTQAELNQQLIALLTQVIAQLQKQIADILASRAIQQSATTNLQTQPLTSQVSVNSMSGPERIGYCSELAQKQYQEANALAEADKKKCEEENPDSPGSLNSIICSVAGSTRDIFSYFSSCLGASPISHDKPTYSPPTYSPQPATTPQAPSFAEQIKQKEMCDLVKGFYLGGHCY